MDKNREKSVPLSKNLISKETSSILRSHNGSIASGDLAPVHSPCSKIRGLSVQKMESDYKPSNTSTTASSTGHELDSISNNLSTNMKEKLSLSSKSNGKTVGKNGMRLGSTDVEVHYGVTFSTQSSDMYKTPSLASVSNAQLSCLSSQEKKNCLPSTSELVGKPSPMRAICNSTTNPICSFKPDPLCFKPELNFSLNGTLCNGHTISEATSSTNSLAISDFSISSEKSTSLDSSFSCSGAQPRQKEKTNSGSSLQCFQPGSIECEVALSPDLSSISRPTSESSNSYISHLLEERNINSQLNLNTKFLAINPRKEEFIPVRYVNYENENQMESIMSLIQKDLSEPYSIYTYRYFIHNWPKLCFLAMHEKEVVGAIVCKLDVHKKTTVRGYIAMLAVDERCRKRRIGSNLVQRAIREMSEDGADEVVLETEITNKPALQLYENLGFVRDKRLFRYYLNGVDALRLKLWLR